MENSLYIVWNVRNETGIAIIDEQHRGIVSAINSLHSFIREGLGNEVLQPTLGILEQYIHIHFKTEERLMKEAKYPAFKEHVLMHGDLAKKTREITISSISRRDSEAVLQFLKDWWMTHINKEDKKYAPHVLKLMDRADG